MNYLWVLNIWEDKDNKGYHVFENWRSMSLWSNIIIKERESVGQVFLFKRRNIKYVDQMTTSCGETLPCPNVNATILRRNKDETFDRKPWIEPNRDPTMVYGYDMNTVFINGEFLLYGRCSFTCSGFAHCEDGCGLSVDD